MEDTKSTIYWAELELEFEQFRIHQLPLFTRDPSTPPDILTVCPPGFEVTQKVSSELDNGGLRKYSFIATAASGDAAPVFNGVTSSLYFPSWQVNSHIAMPFSNKRFIVQAEDIKSGDDIIVIAEHLLDSRGELRVMHHAELLMYMCDASWFNDYTLAMYCKDDPKYGLQFYVILPHDYMINNRYVVKDLMAEFKVLQSFYDLGKANELLSPLAYRVFEQLMTYLSKLCTRRSVISTVRQPGITLLKRLFKLQEIRRPVQVHQLQHICVTTISLCLSNEDDAVNELPLPKALREYISESASFLIREEKAIPKT